MNLPRPSLFLRPVGIVLISALMISTAFAQSSPTDDAQTKTSGSSAGSNFGNNPGLAVSSSGNVYIRFDPASSLPAGTPGSRVEKATLSLFIGNVSSPGKIDVYEVLSEWQESTITANNAPVLGNLVTTTEQISAGEKGKFLIIDLTETVRRWLGSDGQGAGGLANHGVALVANLETPEIAAVTFDSKENPQTSHEPRLQIILQGEAGAGLEMVAHDGTLAGDGTIPSPLKVAESAIGTSQLADGAVSEAKLINGAVTTTKLANGSVTQVKLADGSVTSAKIATPLSLMSAGPDSTLSVANAGTGAAITATGAISTTTQYQINGRRILGVSGAFDAFPTTNTFVGDNAGLNLTPDPSSSAGKFNTLFGAEAGRAITLGNNNSIFGARAGEATTVGFFNSFFGAFSGRFNDSGFENAFFGAVAGFNNVDGDENTFIGAGAGTSNTTGNANSFFGRESGGNNQTGSKNTLLGAEADVGLPNLQNATAIGFRAVVFQSNSLVLGSIAGINAATDTVNVGIGTTAPDDRLHVNGIIRVDALGAAGAVQLCRNASNQISSCSSSLRYKDQIAPFLSGLDLIERLRPITFSWRAGGGRDLGLGAEEVAEVDPLLVTRNDKGEVEGVKYDRIAVVLINAVKQQQQIINEQQQSLKAQQLLLEGQMRQIESLKKIVCLDRPDAHICR